jgi:hypothetical protein
MKNNAFAGIFPSIILLFTSTICAGQTSSNELHPAADSGAYFLYVKYCGTRYNRNTHCQELVIEAVKLPVRLLKSMPRLKENDLYSSKNIKRYYKQLEVVRQNGGEKLSIRVNRKKFSTFYPKGLKRGIIVEGNEFDQWNFQEKDIPAQPPVEEKRIYHFDMEWIKHNPLHFYGLVKLT